MNRIAVDFGSINTTLSYWDHSRNDIVTLKIPQVSRREVSLGEKVWYVPSLVNYSENGEIFYGNQVLDRQLCSDAGTFRWMKRYISARNPSRRKVGNRFVDHFEAGRNFLSFVIRKALEKPEISRNEMIFTVPVESFEHYENWIDSVACSIDISNYRLIDEPSAALLGYKIPVQANSVFLIFDFGGSTLDVSVVQVEDENIYSGCKCRVLGKAGEDLGGSTIDSWLFKEIVDKYFNDPDSDEVNSISLELLFECERVKKELSFKDHVVLSVDHMGLEINHPLTRIDFEEILQRNDLYNDLICTVMRALNNSMEYGYTQKDIEAVLMIGGSSNIPSVQRVLKQIFGNKVNFQRPRDVVSRGAAAFAAGADFCNHIQHDYAVRHVNPRTYEYEYETIVRRGTSYPTVEPVRKLRLKPSYHGQKYFGLLIYEFKNQQRFDVEELVFDTRGNPRIVQILGDENKKRKYFNINAENPVFISADPPADINEARFELQFNVNHNGFLVLTALDLKTNKVVYKDYPVVKLGTD